MTNPADEHLNVFLEIYNQFPQLEETRRVAWAERIANSPSLRMVYSLRGRNHRTGPYEPADYTNDKRAPLRPGGGPA